ncbi:hypothetical protein RAMLITH_05445 [Ramlibacter sp. RBP-2]|uniref:DUF2946 domain-containing protein n=1 Tax=Ramlibacter lithotrophicus TaxID=2606681 RepID=A0A7X6I5E7_9BURK|nr:hypothetical protein [Ramlibacter lithotrophicus]NKE65258.1 hypothetical protein [Ramlibacter lithotrophicus]
MQFRARVLRRTLPALVVVALLFAQALGLLHGIAHGPIAGAQAQVAANAADDRDAASDVFSHEAGEPTCRLFDALTCGGAVPTEAGPAPACPAALERPLAHQAPLAARAAQFQARGPPVLS